MAMKTEVPVPNSTTMKIEVPVPNCIAEDEQHLSRYIDMLITYKDHIDSLYLPLGWVGKMTDGRHINAWGIRAPNFAYINGEFNEAGVQRWEEAIREVLDFVKLPVRVLMNDTFNPMFSDPEALARIGKKLAYYAANFEIKSVMITDPTLIPFLKGMGYPISLSTNSHNSFAELDSLFCVHDPSTFESITLQRDLNRNPTKLRKYTKSRGLCDKVVLMVNEGCVNSCAFKQSGDEEISATDIYTHNNRIHKTGCTMLDRKVPWTFLTSPFLTHGMVKGFYHTQRVIKIAGRDLTPARLEMMMDHYVNGTEHRLADVMNVSFSTNATTSDFTQRFISRVMSCNKECFVCNDCKDEFNRLIDKHDKRYIPIFLTELTHSPA